MSFDKATRNALASMVGTCRKLLVEDYTDQLRGEYGMHPDGTALELSSLQHLDPTGIVIAQQLRDELDHLEASSTAKPSERHRDAYDRLVRELGFTAMNRLAALRMCEERGLIAESVRKGAASEGASLFARIMSNAVGDASATYRLYLELLFDELAVDLGVLFDRKHPTSLLFPSEKCLNALLDELNAPTFEQLWANDETIGWIYQYWNSAEERRAMRDASSAPRNSRELAVRNQFFTPRYVVEFLTDNTLGRTWYEMRRGDTTLTEGCEYLVRRKRPVFLAPGEDAPPPYPPDGASGDPDLPGDMWVRPDPDSEDLAYMWRYALTVGGYDYAKKHLGTECADLANERLAVFRETGKWEGNFDELRCCLFFEQRRWHHFGDLPDEESHAGLLALYRALCERWDVETEFVPYREKKLPWTITILDPAVGSGHFLLYCFDVLETIYDEAYDDPDLGPQVRAQHPDRDLYRRDVPGMILAYNLHGIDIDPRCAQIASLALWLRAQRAYRELGVTRGKSPEIRRTNIVCAEPMPGETALLEEYCASLSPSVLGDLVRVIWEKMKLAGEAGSLLKIEEEIRDAVRVAEEAWRKAPKAWQVNLFDGESERPAEQAEFDFSGVTSAEFWRTAEDLLLDELKGLSEHAEASERYARRLFSEDAARGFAFIDLCRRRFDVALMNPPFGLPTANSYQYLVEALPSAYSDLSIAMMTRGLAVLAPRGLCGSISSRAFMAVTDAERFRRTSCVESLTLLADLGLGVMDDALVDASAQVMTPIPQSRFATFVDLRPETDKDGALRLALSFATGTKVYVRRRAEFVLTPGCRLAYDQTPEIAAVLTVGEDGVDPLDAQARIGASTFEDERFLRLRWEVPSRDIGPNATWCLTAKSAAEFSLFYYPCDMVSKWNKDGRELGERNRIVNGSTAQARQSSAFYFKPGLVFSRRSSPSIAFRVHPRDCRFSSNTGVVIPYAQGDIAFLMGILNSRFVRAAILAMTNRESYTVGHVRAIRHPVASPRQRGEIERNSQDCFAAKREALSYHETDHHFPGLGAIRQPSIRQTYDALAVRLAALQATLLTKTEALDREVGELFGITNQSSSSMGTKPADAVLPTSSFIITPRTAAVMLLSEALGVAVGRWDLRVCQRGDLQPAPYPIDVVPGVPPALLVSPDGYDASRDSIVSRDWLQARSTNGLRAPSGEPGESAIGADEYPGKISWDGVLVDDEGHGEDVVARIRQTLALLWPGGADEVESEACELLNVETLRDYFRKPTGFFGDHLKRHSRSRRQAPIYWPLSTSSGSYTLWVYYHRLNDDFLFMAVNRYVEPKISDMQRLVARYESELLSGASTKTRQALDDARKLLDELRDFRDELLRVANMPYKPDLNDGVLITAAPLWKLFRLPKWRKDLEACWKKLEAGEYDWAHLAYSIWPDRVRKVCETDRSIAIAHDLEDLCKAPVAAKSKRKATVALVEDGDEDTSNGDDE